MIKFHFVERRYQFVSVCTSLPYSEAMDNISAWLRLPVPTAAAPYNPLYGVAAVVGAGVNTGKHVSEIDHS